MGVKLREKPVGSGIWYIRIRHNGRDKSKKIGDKNLAREVPKKIEAKLVLGDLNIEKIGAKCPTFEEHAEKWLALPSNRKPQSTDYYRANLKNHAYPAFGGIRVDQITRRDIKMLFDKMSFKGLSTGTIALVKIPLGQAFNYAAELELIDSNPVDKVTFKRPWIEPEGFKPLTEHEAFAMLDKAEKHRGGQFYAPILCSLRTGVRFGELQCITWADIDFESRLINVSKSFRQGYGVGTTKTRKARKVDMTAHLTDTLRKLKAKRFRESLKAGKPMPEFVFAYKGRMMSRFVYQKALNDISDAAKVKRIHIHDLRHSYATIRLLKGHNIGDVSYQLGHASIKITYDVYAHWIPGTFKSQVDELDERSGEIQRNVRRESTGE